MSETMRAFAVDVPGPVASHPLRELERAVPEPHGDEIRVRVSACGVCRTDLHLALRNPDLTTAERMAAAIDKAVGGSPARALDPRTVALDLEGHDVVATLARIEELRITPDSPAVVVVEEASGTIVMGDNVRISTVAVAQGNLTVRVTETPEVSQPNALAGGQTVVVPRTDVQVQDGAGRKMGIVREAATLRDLVASLNALGVGPRDMISILQSIKAAGALQAELEVR